MSENKIVYYKYQIEKKMFSEPDSYNDLTNILRTMKEDGITQKSAYDMLEEIRGSEKVQQNEKIETIVLDLMDVVGRYCAPHHYIW